MGRGPSKADIMVVGDFPTYGDDNEGRPFKGDSGAKLNYLLRKAGLKRKDVYVTNAVKCKPWNKESVKAANIDACRKHLFEEILSVRPKIIVAMGGVSLQSTLAKTGTGENRGFFWDFELEYEVEIKPGKEKKKVFKTQVMPTYAPLACLTKWEFDKLVIHDLKKSKKYVETGKIPQPPKLNVTMVTNMKMLNKVTDYLCRQKEFTYDFETTGLKFFEHDIVMAGFCSKPGRAFVIPYFEYDIKEHGKKWDKANKDFAVNKVNPFVKAHKKEIQAALKKIMASKARKNAWNGKFDDKFARYNKFRVKNWTRDGILEHALLDENVPHNLTFALEFYGVEYGPYDQKLWKYVNKTKANKKPYSYVPPLMLGDYLGMDVDGAERLKRKFKPLLMKQKLWKTPYLDRQMPLVREMADTEYRGMKCDSDKLQRISKDFGAVLSKIEKQVKRITKNKDFNFNSPRDIVDYLEGIGAPLEKKTKGGNFSVDKEVLEKLANGKRKYAKVPKLILETRAITKLKGTYLDGKDGDGGLMSHLDRNHKVHANWNLWTPRTGRMSCDDPPLQTIPRPNPRYPEANIRQLFIPSRPGWGLASIDYAQLEMRIAAFLSKDLVMINEIRKKVDIHSRNAVKFGTVLGILPSDMTEKRFIEIKDYKAPKGYEKLKGDKRKKIEDMIHEAAVYSELRTLAKSLGFGLNYGMTASTLAQTYGREEDEIQEMIDIYFDKYEALALWREDMKRLSIEKGVLVLPETGRKRRFTSAADWFNSPYSQNIRKRDFDMEAIFRQAMNFPIQGYANEVFTEGKLKLIRDCRKQKLSHQLVLSLHDGILMEGKLNEMLLLRSLANKNMTKVLGKGTKYEVKLEVDFDLYDRWAGNKLKAEDYRKAA